MADQEEAEVVAKKPIFNRKIILIIGGIVILLLIAGLGVAYLFGAFDSLLERFKKKEDARISSSENLSKQLGYFFPMDEMSISLNSNGGRSRVLRLKLILELEQQSDQDLIKQALPRVVDNFQVYLRELRVSELQGTQGIYRLREELLKRINAALSPIKIKDVLFNNITLQ